MNKETLSSLIVGEGFKLGSVRRDNNFCREEGGEATLVVDNLTKFGVFKNINFTLRKGEILGLAGLRGSGRTEIFRAIVGIDPFDEGCIKMDNVLMRFSSPSHALKNGIVFLPEDRDTEGLISVLTVRENLVLNALGKVSRKLFVSKKKENEIVTDLVQTLGIKIASPEQEVNQLSGGNKQKVVVGRITAAEPKVFLLDEPTRGIDISAKESILRIISEKLISSAGILITSPGLEDLIMVCDRILVLFKGEIIAQYIRGEYEEGKLFLAIQGVVKST
jgi:ABC-type sugar transport system ATPase subunit